MPVQLTKLTEDEFARFADLVYKQAGIFLAPEKLTLLSNRLRRRLRALEIASFDEYYEKFSDADFSDDELPYFLSAVTTNETYFFRNARLWETMEQRLIPEFVSAHSKRTRSIKVWSAASSSGEEAYSVAITLREKVPNFSQWKLSVVASDISKKVLEHAQKGLYGDYAVAQMDPERRKRWFTEVDDKFQLKDEIRSLVNFRFHNLREPFPMGGFDLVLLRNVLMYFDTPMKLLAIETACRAVAPGGYLFVGDVDPIRTTPELVQAMELQIDGPGLYHKPSATAATLQQPIGTL